MREQVSAELVRECIQHGTRTSIACTHMNKGQWRWKHKYMLRGLYVITEPWTTPPEVLQAYWAVDRS
jgi:hypothetical protein